MNESELEDLEAHLYSQIYHSNDAPEEAPELQLGNNYFVKPADVSESPGRYWKNRRAYNLKPNDATKEAPELQLGNNYFAKPADVSESPGRRGKNKFTRVYNLRPRYNNLPLEAHHAPQNPHHQSEGLVNQTNAIQFVFPYLNGKARKRARYKEKRRQMLAERRKRISDSCLKSIKPTHFNNVSEQVRKNVPGEVITLSDSDENDDSCLIIDNKWPCLSVVDSDDEGKTKQPKVGNNKTLTEQVHNESQNDDVIFVEPVSESIEVINLDEECESSLDKTNKTHTATVSKISKAESLKQLQQERRELLSTPDSASNDFMNNSGIELSKTNFNFSQHGSDFNTEFLKTSKHNETAETETSSSTTDVNSVNIMNTAVFNEVEFPKDIFSESNLEAFGNFITPLRGGGEIVHSSPVKPPEAKQPHKSYTESLSKTQIQNNSSDSSSESEPEETSDQQKEVSKKFKKLPELSPMQTRKEASNPKKTKSSRCELSVSEDSKQYEQTRSTSKKKKNKKRKSENENPSDNTLSESNNEGLKLKKRKSSQMEVTIETLDQSKKKNKNKKKRSTSDGQGVVVSISSENKRADKEIDFNKEQQEVSVVTGTVKDTGVIITQSSEENQENLIRSKSKSVTNPESKKDQKTFKDTPEGFIVIDETFATNTDCSSDTESVLSKLDEPGDIQLINLKEQPQNDVPSTSDTLCNIKDFSVTALQHSMSSDPKLWKILDSDRWPLTGRRARRCNRCKELGHITVRCPKRIIPKCKICGEVGHYEPRCPNKLCNQCGKESPYSTTYCKSCFKLRTYQCPLCSMTGHLPEKCPDLWRRYHLTTTDGPLTTYETSTLRMQKEMWCSGCAQSGHLEYTCTYYRSVYPPSDPFVKSYEDIYSPRQYTNTAAYDNDYVPNFNQNNAYTQSYDPTQGFYINNQQNFYYNSDPRNMFQYPTVGGHGYGQVYNNFNFESDLPNYISFETPLPPQETYAQVPMMPPSQSTYEEESGKQNIDRLSRRHNSVFFSSTARSLQQFIQVELGKLQMFAYEKDRRTRELKKRPVPRDFNCRRKYYQSLNMLLFGVYYFRDGKMHVDRLKTFKMSRFINKINHHERDKLYRSYRYIFGLEQHMNVDYNELLSRI